MKTTLAALATSLCILGIGTAATNNNKAKDSPPAHQETGKHPAKADQKKAKHGKKTRDPEARKKAAKGREAKDLTTRLDRMEERRERAEAMRGRAAKTLKAAEVQIASIDAEKKKLLALKQAEETAARKKAELDRNQAAQLAEAKERQNVARMQAELSALKQSLARLNQQVTDLREKPHAPDKKEAH